MNARVLLKLVVPPGDERKREVSTHIEVDVYYSKGGTSPFDGIQKPRAIEDRRTK